MRNLLENCKKYFLADNLYEVLGIKEDASKQEIKKSYHKKSLIYHPDRDAQDKVNATLKFQLLGQVYSILSDNAKRAEYDETGSIGESSVDVDRDWENYWRLLFPKVTQKDIQEFSEKYRGSDEEKQDLKKVYITSKGDMDIILSNMMCSSVEDEERYSHMINTFIKDGSAPDFPAFSKESKKKKLKRMKKAKQEADEAEVEAKKFKLDDSEQSLIAAIKSSARLQKSESFLADLEARYNKNTCASGSKKKPKKAPKGLR